MTLSMRNPIVEMTGDEYAEVMWDQIKQILLAPFVDLNLEVHDLSMTNRAATDDQATFDAAEAILRHKVGVKCATITPDAEKAHKLGHRRIYPSPNGTIRAKLDGTIFRRPIISKRIERYIANWTKPIVVGRHGFGDSYGALTAEVAGGTELALSLTKDGETTTLPFLTMGGDGVVLVQRNEVESIRRFAHACFEYAFDEGLDVLFSAKDTVTKAYDTTFKRVFAEVADEYAERFTERGLRYDYLLIDAAVAGIIRLEGGLLWACKNYEGDVFGDLVASGYGAHTMLTSELYGIDGTYEYEAAHGTMPMIHQTHLAGEPVYANPCSSVLAWTKGLAKRGQLDEQPELVDLAGRMESALLAVIDEGQYTMDLKERWIGDGALTETTTLLQLTADKVAAG